MEHAISPVGSSARQHPMRQGFPPSAPAAVVAPPLRHPLRVAIDARRPKWRARLLTLMAHGRYAAHGRASAARERWANAGPALRGARISRGTVREFLLAYCACFVAAMAFLS